MKKYIFNPQLVKLFNIVWTLNHIFCRYCLHQIHENFKCSKSDGRAQRWNIAWTHSSAQSHSRTFVRNFLLTRPFLSISTETRDQAYSLFDFIFKVKCERILYALEAWILASFMFCWNEQCHCIFKLYDKNYDRDWRVFFCPTKAGYIGQTGGWFWYFLSLGKQQCKINLEITQIA